ncbi:unnamed protein product [Tetraodon nigroviridis]|uniref:(spotted green pufferfish) hypothetical protein n=1 Tax=Tetraodon nigroviridis TaxID=99883 RepID=Q4SCI5_TETNG|nr:unnamed protein product [Tetraodon nigroviridis]
MDTHRNGAPSAAGRPSRSCGRSSGGRCRGNAAPRHRRRLCSPPRVNTLPGMERADRGRTREQLMAAPTGAAPAPATAPVATLTVVAPMTPTCFNVSRAASRGLEAPRPTTAPTEVPIHRYSQRRLLVLPQRNY